MHRKPILKCVGLTNLAMCDYRAFAKWKELDRLAAERGWRFFSILRTCVLRQKPSAKSDFCRVGVDAFGRNNGGPKKPKTACIPFLGTT